MKAPYKRTCEECDEPFITENRRERFCSERCQRIAERRRYRARHTEQATCRGCGSSFTRCTTTRRKQVFCTTECQAASRSAQYQEREDIAPG